MDSGATDSQKKQAALSGASKKKPMRDISTLTEPDIHTGIFNDPIMVRANFYRDNMRRLMIFCIFLIFVICGLMGWVIFERLNKPPVHYFTTSNDGKLTLLYPLNQPNLTTSSLLDWVVEAGTTAYNFNFGNYDRALKDIKIYFTDAGYQNFLNALTAARTIDTVRTKQLVVAAIATDKPVILKEGPTTDGIYAWEVQLPMLVTYQSASDTRKQNIVLTMLIARRSTLESPKGIGIASIKVREA
ncbi:MAG: type IVB secretion system apparatus protein IcmL/DotI [Gammaproteobacteria bacterium]|jgi:intracellular multiplication protein IcmL|nr:type IVB secretion system apparatus protein IcmL/DotI [Gammaproteobacteria bacterium]